MAGFFRDICRGASRKESETGTGQKLAVFSEDELLALEQFFEKPLHGRCFSCEVNAEKTVFSSICDVILGMGWHDESWHDLTRFTITKYSLPMPDKSLDEKDLSNPWICSFADNANSCRITKQEHEEDFHYNADAITLLAEGFLGFSENVRIICRFSKGEW